MNFRMDRLLDGIGRKILAALQENARLPFSHIGAAVGLSAPAVAERVKKMEEAGIIHGYHARIDAAAMGRPVTAFIQLTTESRHYPAVSALADRLPAIMACHHVSGEASFILQVRVADLSDLEAVVADLSPFGATRTAIVLSTQVDKAILAPLG